MPTNYRTAIRSFQKHAKDNVTAVARDVASQIAESLVIFTPVDTTRAEANWQGALNTIPQEFNEAARNIGGSRPNLDKAKAIAKQMQLGDVFVMANSTPYIIFLNEGSSRQAPAGMTILVIAAFQRMVERARRKAL